MSLIRAGLLTAIVAFSSMSISYGATLGALEAECPAGETCLPDLTSLVETPPETSPTRLINVVGLYGDQTNDWAFGNRGISSVWHGPSSSIAAIFMFEALNLRQRAIDFNALTKVALAYCDAWLRMGVASAAFAASPANLVVATAAPPISPSPVSSGRFATSAGGRSPFIRTDDPLPPPNAPQADDPAALPAVPLPASIALLLGALGTLVFLRRRRI